MHTHWNWVVLVWAQSSGPDTQRVLPQKLELSESRLRDQCNNYDCYCMDRISPDLFHLVSKAGLCEVSLHKNQTVQVPYVISQGKCMSAEGEWEDISGTKGCWISKGSFLGFMIKVMFLLLIHWYTKYRSLYAPLSSVLGGWLIF